VLFQVFGSFIGGFVVAFITGWLMTLVCLSAIPLIGLSGYLYMWALQKKKIGHQEFYAKAGGKA
jgi:ATP-binding cassette subfamily B (MDR/TAP) protein 1